ncbi:MAG: NADH-quinone oxidoreductase subunit C [Candidatus Paracaedibacteraceae bacterium]|nr:NADH-quinone oxidoreductase subunit C [Candidatus Paracaedibacteraceae bacterium]
MDIKYFDQLTLVLKEILGPDFIEIKYALGEATLTVYPASIVRVLTILNDHHKCKFKQLIDITAVDYPSHAQRFEVVYHLLSLSENVRLRIKINVAEGVSVPTSIQVFSCANWYEREIWDLFGIAFMDHPDLRRILTDYNFSGHPLRKDFPLTGYTQVRYCEKEGRVIYEPVYLQQEYRSFDFLSPWEGGASKLESVPKLENV